MANKNLFTSFLGKLLPKPDLVNEAGGPAYAFGPEHALGQYAATGCLNGTFYASAQTQLDVVLKLAFAVDPDFLAKCAVYTRQKGHMKDMPALLLAVLSVRDSERFKAAFPKVVDNAKMLRTFVQIMRSGAVGRKSLGTRPKKEILAWLASRSDEYLFRGSVGNDPSLADVLKMVHPKPASASRRALYGYLLGKSHETEALPELVKAFEAYKREKSGDVPKVPFQMLTALSLGRAEWTEIAKSASWQMTRMNLNTFQRHGVFEVEGMTERIAARLADPALVRKARAFPYQLMTAYVHSTKAPTRVRNALQDAMEHALANVPRVDGHVWVCPDVSGSMQSPVTGWRKGATSAVKCVDVAALFAAALVRHNPRAGVIPFEFGCIPVELNPRDSIMTNARKLASIGGGGTNVSAPLAKLNAEQAKADLVVFVSDNQSWVDARRHGATETMREWNRLKARNPKARMVCIDVQPYGHSQAPDSPDILNVGGFSDQVFDVVAAFAQGADGAQHWVDVIRGVSV
ncbi:MAG: TROVE domain-containing protein [Sandaracinaceae bacterium]|nr:MAG: TROVE domain-containing protein [Sandaracinaceae bacterium]